MPRGTAFVVSEAPKSAKEPGNPHGSAELFFKNSRFFELQRVVAIAFPYGYFSQG
jgi:hypothetical protein